MAKPLFTRPIQEKANHFVLHMPHTLKWMSIRRQHGKPWKKHLNEANFDEGDSHAWLGEGFDEEEEAQEQEFDYLEDEEEAIALNAMLDLEEADDRQAGEAI